MNVSIVIPAYDAADTLTATLESLRVQTHADWEAIVVDDGSTDTTGDVARSFSAIDERIRLVTRPNGGEAAARNTGLCEARHPWILFLDADDWIAPHHLERMTAALEADPALDAVHCRHARVAADGSRVIDAYRPPTGDLFPTLARRAAFPIHACLVRKSLVDQVGQFDTSLKTSPDWDVWQRIARTGANFGAVDEVLAFYRMSPSGASLDAAQLFQDGMRVLRQGHAADDRVPQPHPDHRHGAPADGVLTQEFYLLSWCAGLLLGDNRDARPLLQLIGDDCYPELYPAAVAQCILEAAPLSTCRTPGAWGALWPVIEQPLKEFLAALEGQSRAPELAARTLTRLKRMVLEASPLWGVMVDELDAVKAAAAEGERSLQQEAHHQLQDRYRQLEGQHQEVLDAHQEVLDALQREKEERRRSDQQHTILLASAIADQERKHRDQLAVLRSSPEWVVGDTLWNAARLSRLGRPLARGLRTLRDRRNRLRLTLGRGAVGIGMARPRVIVAACWSFPIHSQTFVYQEIQALDAAGLESVVFCCQTNAKSELPAAFAGLWRRRVVLGSEWTLNQRDLAYFRRTRPDRVESLLARISQATGFTKEALLQQSVVTMGFTFARHVELSGAAYLHTYFFYDQSFMALMAAYLLEIPRGVTAYADHLLQDDPFKCVALHLELADIIVATSRRIKGELSAIGGGRFDDKIIVKPNGIDTTRFPYVAPEDRLNEDREPELIAVNRIEPKKGLIYLVEAMAILKAQGRAVRLHIVGAADPHTPSSAGCLEELTARIDELGLADRIILHGMKQQAEFSPLLARSRVFIAPYVEVASGDKDGIPTAVLEAMATGLPIVATDAGSIGEAVTDGVEAVCVPQRDPARLADAIERLLTDRTLYLAMADAARRRAVSEFDIRVTERRLHERILACIGASGR